MLLIYKKFLNVSDRTMPLSEPPQFQYRKILIAKAPKSLACMTLWRLELSGGRG
jgi:hypothetical protein